MLRQLSPQPGRGTGREELTKRKLRDPNQPDSLTSSLRVCSRPTMTMFSTSTATLTPRHSLTKHHVDRAREEGSRLPLFLAVLVAQWSFLRRSRQCEDSRQMIKRLRGRGSGSFAQPE